MKYIIGISGYFHDSSVCLFANNSMIEFIREETLTRVKGTNHFPYRSLNFLKTKYELDRDNIEFVCFYEKPLRGWFSNISLSFRSPFKRRELLKNQLKQFWNGPTNVSHHIIRILEIAEEKILFAPHHVSHVLSAIPYQRTNLDDTALHFVFDAVGDGILRYCAVLRSNLEIKIPPLDRFFLFSCNRMLRI